MAASFAKQVRKEQTQLELHRLKDELAEWLKHHNDEDKFHQYQTQLGAIGTLIRGTAEQLETAVAAFATDQRPQEEVYAECRSFDLRILWLRRVWEFFKEKFDQRDHTTMGRILQAADEVVWSCYRQVVLQVQHMPGMQQRPVPLPFIESHYSPEAFPSELIPPDLKDTSLGESFLRDHLNQLPLSIVRLPPMCIRSPWWLVYLGHEMGHHVQHDLELVDPFRERIEEVVLAQNGGEEDEEEVTNWGRWSEEIFADIFSVCLMGQWTVRAMLELELNQPDVMLRRRSSYPAPFVRLRLLAETANALQLNGEAMLHTLNTPTLNVDTSEVKPDVELVPFIVKAALEDLPSVGLTLQDLTDFRRNEFLPGGSVAKWVTALLDLQNLPSATEALSAARLLSSASFAAWSQTLEDAHEEDGEVLRKHLSNIAPDIIARCRDHTTRAGEKALDLGTGLADLLLTASPQQLEL